MDKLTAGSLLKVSFEMRLPIDATEAQIEEWLLYAVLQAGGCSIGNPLLNQEVEEWANSFEWEDTGMMGRREEFDHWSKTDGSSGCRVRYVRERRPAMEDLECL